MDTTSYFKERFDQLQALNGSNGISSLRQSAFEDFNRMGIPGPAHEEWKYTRIGNLFNKEFSLSLNGKDPGISRADIDDFRLPGHPVASELVFVNGIYSPSLSVVRTEGIDVLPLEEAARNQYKNIVEQHLGHSSDYLKDGINALNTAFIHGGVFIAVQRGQAIGQPVYIYNITDARAGSVLSQPRSLVHVGENAEVEIVETYMTLGPGESFTNQVIEIVVERDAIMEYYKIQNDAPHANQVSTTHIRQVAKSYVHTVCISLNGGIVRNNLNVVLEAEHCEAHLYGLYFQEGESHIDNHTVVDNVKPNCFSNEFYKGIMDGQSSGVFNGKIFVRPQAQKTNAYQSNKNILLSSASSVNTKPQLEIFADDVKCSHGCTIGQLNDEGLFYLRARGISEKTARALLLHAFAIDILEHIKPEPIRAYVDRLISQRLEYDIA